MSMETVKQIIKEAGAGFLATTDGDRPGVRPMGGGEWVGQEMWLASGKDSAKVADIQARPRVEICYMAPDYRHVRIAGECRVSTAPADKERLFKLVPMMEQYFSGPQDPGFVVLRLKPDSIRLMESDMQYVQVL